MKKSVLLLALAALLASACAKNEVIPSSDSEAQEITFNMAPVTKAALSDFGHDKKFRVSAYYSQKKWDEMTDNEKKNAFVYIDNAVITYDTDRQVWKCADKTYYWPKSGMLTFFAWSLNDDSNVTLAGDDSPMGFAPNFEAVNGAIYVPDNKNKDFLVADAVKDQTANSEGKDWGEGHTAHNGVPTIFRHKMSQVAFKVRTAQDYSASKTIMIKSITFKSVIVYSSYGQYQDSWTDLSFWGHPKADLTYYANVNGQEAKYAENNDTADNIPSSEYYIYLPQNFSESDPESTYLEIKYTIATNGTTAVEEVVAKQRLDKLYTDNWKMGKKYVSTIVIGLDGIQWDPAVEEWEEENSGNIEIN